MIDSLSSTVTIPWQLWHVFTEEISSELIIYANILFPIFLLCICLPELTLAQHINTKRTYTHTANLLFSIIKDKIKKKKRKKKIGLFIRDFQLCSLIINKREKQAGEKKKKIETKLNLFHHSISCLHCEANVIFPIFHENKSVGPLPKDFHLIHWPLSNHLI